MFSFRKKSKLAEEKSAGVLVEGPPVKPWEQIYVMPTSFQDKAKVETGQKRNWLVIILSVLVLAIVVSLVYWFMSRQGSPPPGSISQEAGLTNQPEVTATTGEPAVPPAPTTTAAERDSGRYRDIRNLQTALELYKGEQKKYPVALLPLVLGLESTRVLSTAGFTSQAQGTIYLDKVPANHQPGGLDYLYESGDGTNYTITFSLEEGTAGLGSGEHKATTQGIDNGTAEVAPPLLPRTVTPPNLSLDSDQDGLTDMEEIVFGTDPKKPDSDGDGFLDGSEVAQGFDPAKASGAKLEDSVNLAAYNNKHLAYTIKYPVKWLAKPTETTESEVIFSGGGDEFIEVLVVDNPEKLSAAAWYAKQVTGLKAEEVPAVSYGNLTWAMSLDGLNAYTVDSRDHLITVSYNIGTKTEASYYHLFQMTLRSFIWATP
ncbi:MAG: hypothetical protein HY973_02915 [Candidatus Kerfeldbacteria bacterium]|nr:hypothetical protein [Candidatus Kerfeldbacteria bacterium]